MPANITMVTQRVQQWVKDVVVGLNFCPFAKREVEKQRIRYACCEQIDAQACLQAFLDEVYLLDANEQTETTLLIYTQAYQGFDEYLELLEQANRLIEQGGYVGLFQIASFHPDYVFNGEAEEDPANYTNRAPYPILHILREASIERALRTYKDPDSIPLNNIEKARSLGTEALHTLCFQNAQGH